MFRHDARKDPTPPSHRWAMRQFQEGKRSHLLPGGPKTHILKAVVEGSGEAVGVAIIMVFKEGGRVHGEEVGTAKGVDIDAGGGDAEEDIDDGLNHEFCNEWITRMNEVYEQEMDGKDHACRWLFSLDIVR